MTESWLVLKFTLVSFQLLLKSKNKVRTSSRKLDSNTYAKCLVTYFGNSNVERNNRYQCYVTQHTRFAFGEQNNTSSFSIFPAFETQQTAIDPDPCNHYTIHEQNVPCIWWFYLILKIFFLSFYCLIENGDDPLVSRMHVGIDTSYSSSWLPFYTRQVEKASVSNWILHCMRWLL